MRLYLFGSCVLGWKGFEKANDIDIIVKWDDDREWKENRTALLNACRLLCAESGKPIDLFLNPEYGCDWFAGRYLSEPAGKWDSGDPQGRYAATDFFTGYMDHPLTWDGKSISLEEILAISRIICAERCYYREPFSVPSAHGRSYSTPSPHCSHCCYYEHIPGNEGCYQPECRFEEYWYSIKNYRRQLVEFHKHLVNSILCRDEDVNYYPSGKSRNDHLVEHAQRMAVAVEDELFRIDMREYKSSDPDGRCIDCDKSKCDNCAVALEGDGLDYDQFDPGPQLSDDELFDPNSRENNPELYAGERRRRI